MLGQPTAVAETVFVPLVEPLDLQGREMPDVEWEHRGNQATWQDAALQLWVVPMDWRTGDFLLESSLLLATNLAPAFPLTSLQTTGNGPEWGNDSSGSFIGYSIQDGPLGRENWKVGIAREAENGWQAGSANNTMPWAGGAPEPTKTPNDPDPLIACYYQAPGETSLQAYWHSLRNPTEAGRLPFANSAAVRWADETHLLVSTMTVNNIDQVVLFDPATPETYTQLTFDATYTKQNPWLWRAPEFGNELVMMALENPAPRPAGTTFDPTAQQVGLYRVIDGVWTRFETVKPPVSGVFTLIKSAEVFVYNGCSYLFLPQIGSMPQKEGSKIWIAGIGANQFYRQVADPADGVLSTDPEYWISEAGVFLYLCQGKGAQVYRAWSGLGPRSQNLPAGMAEIPRTTFAMGDSFGEGAADEQPVHLVTTSAFFMDRSEVSSALWQQVATWGNQHGYLLAPHLAKTPEQPVTVNWAEAVQWCNARSEKEARTPAYYTDATRKNVYRQGNVNLKSTWVNWATGYRLPTEAEWENAARGGAAGHRFPWPDAETISLAQANYYSAGGFSYDLSAGTGFSPLYAQDGVPYTAPAISFDGNPYGLHDMAGNLWQWCWDPYNSNTYTQSSAAVDPRGWPTGRRRVIRGGSWASNAYDCRVARRGDSSLQRKDSIGFRSVLPE